MRAGRIHSLLRQSHADGRSLLAVLIDPDRTPQDDAAALARDARESGADLLLLGGSLSMLNSLDVLARTLRDAAGLPLLLFPGGLHQISGEADAILFLSIVSGRNPDSLIHQHVQAAPMIRRLGLEAVATAYMLIEGGAVSSAEFMSGTRPIPRAKPDIAVAHAMAAELLGFATVYLEAGSGAPLAVPPDTIARVARSVDLPLFVGGGLRTPAQAADAARSGATVVVTGTHFENASNRGDLRAFADAVHDARHPAGLAV